jgi:hypothetical protein
MVAFLLLILSILLLSLGFYWFKGPVSVWYLAYGVATVGASYSAIPAGVAFALWSVAASPFIPDEWKLTVLNIGTIAFFAGILVAGRFLKPEWLRCLEREHKAILPILRMEIQEMGPENWNRQINTQDDLEKWVNEVRSKRGL